MWPISPTEDEAEDKAVPYPPRLAPWFFSGHTFHKATLDHGHKRADMPEKSGALGGVRNFILCISTRFLLHTRIRRGTPGSAE